MRTVVAWWVLASCSPATDAVTHEPVPVSERERSFASEAPLDEFDARVEQPQRSPAGAPEPSETGRKTPGGGGYSSRCVALSDDAMPRRCPTLALDRPCSAWPQIHLTVEAVDAEGIELSRADLSTGYLGLVDGCFVDVGAVDASLDVEVRGAPGQCPRESDRVSVRGRLPNARVRECVRNVFRYRPLPEAEGRALRLRFRLDVTVENDTR